MPSTHECTAHKRTARSTHTEAHTKNTSTLSALGQRPFFPFSRVAAGCSVEPCVHVCAACVRVYAYVCVCVCVVFTNLLSPMYMQELAEADAVKEQVVEVQVRVCVRLSYACSCSTHVLPKHQSCKTIQTRAA